ncbi:NUDIX domain-containing protein [Streptomyces sp. UNOB3_S3]|uniref:NUDIX hydrolase n=1 Tax=Streptomyces sp. UNOB3_S3 TaxID=2871682 RepID=UPI001E550BB2|nr:NUDIX domain-containing protein [Streptomyces sp. UNOB3_S3]MCC3773797.1 NUDIX domain-containing protein [Streptomyces sp. UNOB3_S3]
MTTNDVPEGTAALIYNARGQYLLHLRDNIPGICDPGTWSFIGGNRDSDDETPEEAIRRELLEEAELAIPDLRVFGVLPAHDLDRSKGMITIFHGQWDGDAHALPLTEGIMLHWFDADTTKRLVMASYARTAIDRREASLE